MAPALSIGARENIAAALNDLPQFRGTTSPQTTGTNVASGLAPVDLRGLGVSRTLVLLDGRRFSGDNDLNSVPSILVKAVDVVMGGSSAAWGSGAVAGVVNMVVDQDFSGVKLGVRHGISTYGDAAVHGIDGAVGTSFADARGHLVLGGEYVASAGVVPKTARSHVGRWATVATSDGAFRITPDVGFANAAVGGLILTGSLAGKAFTPEGGLRDFQFGTVVGNDMIGGEGPSNDTISPLVAPQKHYSGLARASFQISSWLTLSGEIRHARAWDDHVWFGDNNRGNISISADNAFLSPAVRALLSAAGETGFTMGRFNSDFPFPRIDYQRVATQGTLAVDGKIGTHWRWSGYYSHGAYRSDIDTPGFVLASNFAQAVDSVLDPVGGQPICRVKLTNPSSLCVPINLFGDGAPSAEALAYIQGSPHQRALSALDVAGVSLRGEPISLPAGPVSVAAGGEVRRESIHQHVGALDSARAFRSFNFAAYSGSFFVKETFAEMLLPVTSAKAAISNIKLDVAARMLDYDVTSTSWSWKIGVTGDVAPGLAARLSRSRDIRSPNLSELFTQATIGYNTITDPLKGTSVYVQNVGGGNRSLRPETADTVTLGMALTPRGANLRLSLDYYKIRVRDVISTLSPQDLVTRCFDGAHDLCTRVVRDAAGNVIQTNASYLNLSQYRTEGIDAELSATMPLREITSLPGDLTLRMSANWVDKFVIDDGVSRFDYAGSQGNAFNPGVPHLRASMIVGYALDDFSARVRMRYLAAGSYNKLVNIINNAIPAYSYLDCEITKEIMARRGWSGLELSLNIANMLNKKPPPQSLYSPYYDVVGRFMTVGLRIHL
ncbi:TonB-dependent receptor domain-containing protein [Sphingomonas sp.]|uniref:TonB-dependent receptor domain-containing protein n=1 Tax=Sphingomonas sp. TaxID=28214 RepID=UPI003B3A0575